MDFKRILWPTDFSENAGKALSMITSLAEKYKAEIHILYVLKDYPVLGASYGDYDPEDFKKIKRVGKADCRIPFRRSLRKIPKGLPTLHTSYQSWRSCSRNPQVDQRGEH